MILSVAIITKDGSPIVVRQYRGVSRTQIMGQLGAFPKLLSKTNQSYIESENIRYVHQDLGEVYMIIITTRDSNILEDLDLLAILVEVTRKVTNCSDVNVSADIIHENNLDLVFAYDECIFDGYRQSVTVDEIMEFMEMKSKEEDEYLQEKRAKEERAKEQLRDKLKEIDQQKRAQKSAGSSVSSSSMQTSVPVTTTAITAVDDYMESAPKPSARKNTKLGKGMALGKKSSARDRAQQMIREEGLSTERTFEDHKPETAAKPLTGVEIRLTEEWNVAITKTGSGKEFSVQGKLNVCSGVKGDQYLQLACDGNCDKFKMMPVKQKDRKLFPQKRQLLFSNTAPGTPSVLLGWRMTSSDISDIPIMVTCWVPDPNAQPLTFSCEVERKLESVTFENISVVIPVLRPRNAVVAQCDGETEVVERENILRWIIPELSDENPTAELEFSVPNADPESFYPITMNFEAQTLYSDIAVEAVSSDADFSDAISFDVAKLMTGDLKVE